MKVSKKIGNKLKEIAAGAVFGYRELGINPEEYTAAAEALERFIKKGLISRASAGVFYKPKETPFGKLKPGEDEFLRPYLFEGKERVAYITGAALYNRMGLTTQVPKNIKIASRDKRIRAKAGSMELKPVKSYVEVSEENYHLLELLDALKDLKNIVDIERLKAIKLIQLRLLKLSKKQQAGLIEIALKYPPRVRALAGALLDTTLPAKQRAALKMSINPLTVYKYGLDKKAVPNAEYWNIN